MRGGRVRVRVYLDIDVGRALIKCDGVNPIGLRLLL